MRIVAYTYVDHQIDAALPEHIGIMDYFKCHDDFRHVLGIIEELRRGA
jgi:hypothetical protein